MDTPGIRETICAALRTESDSGLLRQRLEQQLPQLRELLILPEEKPVDALMAFISDYVESVPGCLNLVTLSRTRIPPVNTRERFSTTHSCRTQSRS